MWITEYKCVHCGHVLDWSYGTPGSRVADNVLIKCQQCGSEVCDPRLKLWSELSSVDIFVTIYLQPILIGILHTGLVLVLAALVSKILAGLVEVGVLLFVYIGIRDRRRDYLLYRLKRDADKGVAPLTP